MFLFLTYLKALRLPQNLKSDRNDRTSLDLNPALSVVKGYAVSAASEIFRPFTVVEFQQVKVGGFGAAQLGGGGRRRASPSPPSSLASAWPHMATQGETVRATALSSLAVLPR